MLKKSLILTLCSLLSFSVLSLRIQNEPLFTYIVRVTYPLAIKGYQSAEELCQQAVMRFIAWSNEREKNRLPAAALSTNNFGQDTYSAQEKEQLLNLLSTSVQK